MVFYILLFAFAVLPSIVGAVDCSATGGEGYSILPVGDDPNDGYLMYCDEKADIYGHVCKDDYYEATAKLTCAHFGYPGLAKLEEDEGIAESEVTHTGHSIIMETNCEKKHKELSECEVEVNDLECGSEQVVKLTCTTHSPTKTPTNDPTRIPSFKPSEQPSPAPSTLSPTDMPITKTQHITILENKAGSCPESEYTQHSASYKGVDCGPVSYKTWAEAKSACDDDLSCNAIFDYGCIGWSYKTCSSVVLDATQHHCAYVSEKQCKTMIQAEDADTSKVKLVTSRNGYTGESYVTFPVDGEILYEFGLGLGHGPNGVIKFRYAAGDLVQYPGRRKLILSLNGGDDVVMEFDNTGSHYVWEEASIELSGFVSGQNTLKVKGNPTSPWSPGLDMLTINTCTPTEKYLALDGCSSKDLGEVLQTGYYQANVNAAHVVCCDDDGNTYRKGISDANSFNGTCRSDPTKWGTTWNNAMMRCKQEGLRLCSSQAELDRACEEGCGYDYALVWTSIPQESQSLYVLGEEGVDSCPTGYNPIYDYTACQVASAALGLDYNADENDDPLQSKSVCNYCGGCKPQSTRVDWDHGHLAKWVCISDSESAGLKSKQSTLAFSALKGAESSNGFSLHEVAIYGLALIGCAHMLSLMHQKASGSNTFKPISNEQEEL